MFNLLSLRYSEKTVLLLLLMTLQLLSYIGWGIYVVADDFYQQFINIQAVKQAIKFYGFSIVVSLLWLIACLYFRYSDLNIQRLFMVGGLSIFLSVMMCAAWVSGLFTMAVGAVLAGAPFIGIIILPISAVLVSTGIAWLVFIMMTAATISGELSYAPIFKERVISHSTEYAEFYFLSQLYFVLPFLILTVAISALYLKQSKQRDEKVLHLSKTDHLTQIYNRRTAHDVLTQLFNSHSTKPVSVVLIDLDFFKSINDLYGHLVGDRVLIAVAAILSDGIRKNDLVARFGGEEFLLILQDTNSEYATEIAERCRLMIERCVVLSDEQQEVSLSASFGIACAIPNTETNSVDLILRQADQALYQAKSKGRNQVVLYREH